MCLTEQDMDNSAHANDLQGGNVQDSEADNKRLGLKASAKQPWARYRCPTAVTRLWLFRKQHECYLALTMS